MVRGDRTNQSTAAKYVSSGAHKAEHNAAFMGDNRDARSWGYWMTLWLTAAQAKLKPGAYDQLRLGQVYCAASSRNDPNFGRQGVYRIPAVSLLKSCDGYDPDYLLCFLPYERKFAALDGDHASVTVFTKASWADIGNDPVPYLNALWEKKPAVPVSRRTRWWATYCFYENARY